MSLSQIGQYRRELWAKIKSGVPTEEAVKDAPEWAAPVVATARRRQAEIDAHQRVLTGRIDVRTKKVEVC